jgi:hypothetical protein
MSYIHLYIKKLKMNVNFFVFLTLLALTIKCSIAAPSLFPNVIAYCDKGWEYSEFFSKCYPDCKPGYSGKGPMVCCYFIL